MPRKARRKCDTGIYHVMLRGNNRSAIFHDDEDCERFLDILQKCLKPPVEQAGEQGAVGDAVRDGSSSHIRVMKKPSLPLRGRRQAGTVLLTHFV